MIYIRSRWLRSVVIRLAAYPVIGYLTVGASIFVEQDKLLFPAPRRFEKSIPTHHGLNFEDLRIPVNERDHLHAWWISGAAVAPYKKVLLVFHGNGYVLEDMVEDEAAKLHEIGSNLMLIDYRGYGSSTPMSPNEATVNEDADAALNYLLIHRRIPIGSVFVLGRSIGTGPATQLALNNSGLGGLILESPFSSIDDAATLFWYLRIYPMGLLLRTHFDNLSKISSVRAPLLIVSGRGDTLTPSWMAEKIFAQARQPKQLYLVSSAGHDDLLSIGGDALTEVLRKFVQQPR